MNDTETISVVLDSKRKSKFWDQPPSLSLVALTCWRTAPFCYIPVPIQQLNPKQSMGWVCYQKGYMLRVFRNGDYLRLSQCLYPQASPAKHLGIFFLVGHPSDRFFVKVWREALAWLNLSVTRCICRLFPLRIIMDFSDSIC